MKPMVLEFELSYAIQAIPKTTFSDTLKLWEFQTHEDNILISLNFGLCPINRDFILTLKFNWKSSDFLKKPATYAIVRHLYAQPLTF